MAPDARVANLLVLTGNGGNGGNALPFMKGWLGSLSIVTNRGNRLGRTRDSKAPNDITRDSPFLSSTSVEIYAYWGLHSVSRISGLAPV